jgi:hypothetical protein
MVTGFGKYRETWSRDYYTLYFCIVPRTFPTTAGIFDGTDVFTGSTDAYRNRTTPYLGMDSIRFDSWIYLIMIFLLLYH